MSGQESVRLERLHDGAVWRVCLATPRSNILDMDKSRRLTAIFTEAASDPGLKAILIEADGPHFSFGASVEEHLPDRCAAMLSGFHGLFHQILDTSVATLAVVRGQCLGGGLELAGFCNRLFAARDARLGQPEIVLGVFAPVASVALVDRVGRSRAEDLCLSGRSIDAQEALRIGLVDELADDPAAAALEYAEKHLLPRSASSLRLAQRALRQAYSERFHRELAAVERLYVDTLMSTADAGEGLDAFLNKREPNWRNE
jgi:cyclohexa-1,5-dienecarbonyl-CoA hydratase